MTHARSRSPAASLKLSGGPLGRAFRRVFVDHPKSVDESYFQHMRFAAGFAFRLFGAAGAALVHAVVPCLFERTARRIIQNMHDELQRR